MSNSEVQAPEWFFFDGGPGSPRYGGDPTKHAVDHDTETFVREVLQNANDQRLDQNDPVRVTFELFELSGDRRNSLLKTLGWDEELRDRLESVADTERGRGYDEFLSRLENDHPLRLLAIHDSNTTGLTGGWEEDSNYAALVRDELYSSKQNDTAGGSYGLGKSVLWTFSGASTVVFYTAPDETPSNGVGETDLDRRLIGRTKLPTHELQKDGPAYQGAGWFCDPVRTEDGLRPGAIEGQEAAELSSKLFLDRPSARGTSMLVVGFRDPTRDMRPDIDELAEEFRRSAVKYFWPAIYHRDLEVSVKSPSETFEADVDSVPEIKPFVDCYRRRDEDESLSIPGDVAGVDIPVELPPLSGGAETSDGKVRLGTRLAAPTDADQLLNRVALFRGSGMVVKYLNQSRVAYSDRNFFAVLACGDARSDTETTAGDNEVDRFFRAAEPPDHDDWISTENLRTRYQQGFRTALDGVFNDVRDALRYLIASDDRRGDALSQRVRKQFPIHGRISRSSGITQDERAFELSGHSTFREGRWKFSGEIKPTTEEFDEWSATISLTGVGEDGYTGESVPVTEVDTDDSKVRTEVEDGCARLYGDVDYAVQFEGKTEKIGTDGLLRGEVGETQLEVEAELLTNRGDEQ
jgi:hypothetical protein